MSRRRPAPFGRGKRAAGVEARRRDRTARECLLAIRSAGRPRGAGATALVQAALWPRTARSRAGNSGAFMIAWQRVKRSIA